MKCVKTIFMGALTMIISNLGARSAEELARDFHAMRAEYGIAVAQEYEEKTLDFVMEKLFAPAVELTFNDPSKVVVDNRKVLKDSFKDIKRKRGSWTAQLQMIITSSDGKQCVIRSLVTLQEGIELDITDFITSFNGTFIDRIDEIIIERPIRKSMQAEAKKKITAIEQLVKDYHAFQLDFGSFLPKNYTKTIETLFSSQFKKIINGQEAVGNRDGLEKQLTNIRAAVDGWSEITDIFTIPSADGKSCTFRYLFNAPKVGWFDILAIMHSSDGEHIDSIDEIYYQPVAGSTSVSSCTHRQSGAPLEAGLLGKVVDAYVAYHNEYGQSASKALPDAYKNLFSPKFRKIGNGKLLADKQGDLEKNLADTKEEIGKWQINVHSRMYSADGKHCTLRYVLSTEKEGKYDVLAVLSSHDGEHIDSIDGVYYALPV